MIKRTEVGMMPRMAAVVAIVLILAAALGAAAALAAPPEGKGKGHGKGGSAAVLTISPDPVAAGTAFDISGSGFNANKMVVVGVSGFLPFETLTADGSGSFNTSYTRALEPGTYTLLAYQEKGHSWEVKGSLTFEVVP